MGDIDQVAGRVIRHVVAVENVNRLAALDHHPVLQIVLHDDRLAVGGLSQKKIDVFAVGARALADVIAVVGGTVHREPEAYRKIFAAISTK